MQLIYLYLQLALNDSCLRRVLCLGHYGHTFKYSNGGGGLLEDPAIHEFSQNVPEMQTMSGNDAMRDLSESVRMITDKMTSDEASAKVILDWREVGRLVDRVLGCICFLTVLILLMWSIRIWSGWCKVGVNPENLNRVPIVVVQNMHLREYDIKSIISIYVALNFFKMHKWNCMQYLC